MDKILNNKVVEEVISMRLPITKDFQRCSFILPDGKYVRLTEHYEAYRFLVVEELVPCIPDAEQLLSELGWIRYSWIGYLTLPDKSLTTEQYKSLENALIEISKLRDSISVQIQKDPRFYINYSLDDIPNIITKIQRYYKLGKLRP